jgi:hypothetical protein
MCDPHSVLREYLMDTQHVLSSIIYVIIHII